MLFPTDGANVGVKGELVGKSVGAEVLVDGAPVVVVGRKVGRFVGWLVVGSKVGAKVDGAPVRPVG